MSGSSTTGDGCAATGSCLHYAGNIANTDFDVVCLPGEGLTVPASFSGIVNSGCGMGAGVLPADAGAFQLGGDLSVGSHAYTPDDNPGTADPSVNIRITASGAGSVGTDDPNLTTITVEITESSDTVLAGTFAGVWSEDLSVDLMNVRWAYLCQQWNMNDCGGLGVTPHAGCVCENDGDHTAADIGGSFRFEL